MMLQIYFQHTCRWEGATIPLLFEFDSNSGLNRSTTATLSSYDLEMSKAKNAMDAKQKLKLQYVQMLSNCD